MVDIQSATAEIRGGEKKKEERKKPQGKNIMVCPITQGNYNNNREKLPSAADCTVKGIYR